MVSSLDSTPSRSPTLNRVGKDLAGRDGEAHQSHSRDASRTINVTPYTTFYASTRPPQLQRHAAMSLLLKTSEGRERTLRFIQYLLRAYCFVRSPLRGATRPSQRATRLLVLVFILSATRKLRRVTELIAPFAPSGTANKRLRAIAGSPALNSATTSTHDAHDKLKEGSVGSTRWLWAQKYAWAGSDPRHDVGYKSAMPPVSDEQSTLLRQRLEGLELTLTLLDTIVDGVSLLARLGVTMTLPFEALRKRFGLERLASALHVSSPRPALRKLFVRSESLADVFWLATTTVALIHSEWERREVWKYGKRVRRLMREEENERDQLEREYQQLSYQREEKEPSANGSMDVGVEQTTGDADSRPPSTQDDMKALLFESERKAHRIRSQRRVLRDLRGRLIWLWWDRLRLGADGIFALCDMLEWTAGGEAIRVVAGLTSAGVGFSQIWSESTRYTRAGHKLHQ